MTNPIFKPNFTTLRWGVPIAIALSLAVAHPARACSPTHGSRPAAIEQRLENAPYAFDGTVERVEGRTLILRVNRYFKGQGPETVRLTGFNQTSCDDFITEPGKRYLFFGDRGFGNTWNAVYDGAFGSARAWSAELEAELAKLGLLEATHPPQNLPQRVAIAVQRAAARYSRLSPRNIDILSYEKRTWSDGCLGLPFPDRGCLQALTPGWLVRVQAGRETLIYHTDDRGQVVERDERKNAESLPPLIANAVKQKAAQRTRLPFNRIEILSAEPRTWSDSCLGIPFPDRGCARVTVEGWIVTVQAGEEKLVYHAETPNNILFIPDSWAGETMSRTVTDSVKRQASQLIGVAVEKLQILNSERQVWPNGCLGLNFPATACTEALVEGWRVTVKADNQQLIYRTDNNGGTVELENGVKVLPAAVRDAVLTTAAHQTRLLSDRLNLVEAFPRIWDGCLGVSESPQQPCTKIAILGWQIVVEEGENRLVYHTDGDASEIRFNRAASRLDNAAGAIRPVPLPEAALPENLPANAVFRQIVTGGIAGEVRETILWRNGRISSFSNRSGVARDRWVTQRQVREFERSLERDNFGEYNRLEFPAPAGSADLFGVTLSARSGTMAYADSEVEKLPQSLQSVLNSWQTLLERSRERPLRSRNRNLELSKAERETSYPWLMERVLFEWLKPLF